jgi:hypothetical protein
MAILGFFKIKKLFFWRYFFPKQQGTRIHFFKIFFTKWQKISTKKFNSLGKIGKTGKEVK